MPRKNSFKSFNFPTFIFLRKSAGILLLCLNYLYLGACNFNFFYKMAEAEVLREINHATAPMNGDLRDLLPRFACGKTFPGKIGVTAQNEEEEDDEMELSLGLSLNGQFGVDPNRGKKPTRSSSISDFKAPLVAPPTAYAPLMRTCSLPAETEEGWRKRKELQSFRRMEAKKKRLQKMKDVKAVRDQASLEANSQSESGINGMRIDVSAQGSESNGGESGTQGLPPQAQPSSQGSIGSLGTCSSGIYESESQPTQGANKCTGNRSPASVRSLLGPASVQSLPMQNETEKSAKLVGAATFTTSDAMEIMRNMMVDMPCVSTRGVGPNGKTVEGFLYRYRKGEEVRIVCVCHGSFLSPAEFVKHAGGGDVAHPLKHIVVNPSPLS